jgi:biotin carboxyl carrier protein
MKKYTFTINGNTYEVSINNVEKNIIDLEVNGTPYSVELDQEVNTPKTPTIVRQAIEKTPEEALIQKTADLTPKGVTSVRSPLPGNISKVMISVGSQVNRGDTLMIMESMKMQNNILSEKSGVVRNINVKVGDTVLQGDILAELSE